MRKASPERTAASRGIAVFAPNWLGDAIMALPAIADIGRHFPAARLVVLARAAVAEAVRLSPLVDEVITLRWGGRALRRHGWRDDLDGIRQARCDTAILLPNSFASAWLATRARIPQRWGYATDLRRPILTRAVPLPRGSRHQSAYYQHLVEALGMEAGSDEPVLDVAAPLVDAAAALLTSRGWDRANRLVVMAPGAAYGTAKQWLPGHFAELGLLLTARTGVQAALVGTAADAPTTAEIRRLAGVGSSTRIIDLAGATTLQTLAGVMHLASVCVSNDSGAMHLAAAVGVPVAAIFGPTRERETAPLTRRGQRAEVLINPVWCRPCMLRECPIDHRCMKGLTPDRVFAAAVDLMGSR
jgi:heptosyltransferase-2